MVERMTAAQLRQMQGEKKAKNKFGAVRSEYDGIAFDSKKEARRWAELKLLERAGEIEGLRRQVPLILEGRDGTLKTRTGRNMRLTVDFYYIETKTGLPVYEDAKGCITRDYEVRRSVAAAMGVEVKEV